MTLHDVVIAGAGPTGLMLAGELALAGVDVALVERRADQTLLGARAAGLHARTLEVLDQRGIVDRFLAAGRTAQVASFSMIPLDLSDFPTRHPYGLALPQERFEQLLAEWVLGLPVRLHRRREVVDFTPDDAGVEVALDGGERLRARFLVGCDGGRSLVRKRAGIDLAGWEPSLSYLIAEFSTSEPPAFGLRPGDRGVNAIAPLADGRARAVLVEPRIEEGDTPSLDELRARLGAVYGTDFGVRDVTWLSRFTDAARQAVSYRGGRAGRVLLAGDAAHVHSPVGGQGLNLGVQDAVNLGWKLAQVVRGTSPEALLDTYQAERHPVAARVLKSTLAATALARGDARTTALREALADIFRCDEPRKRYAGSSSGLDVRYDLGDGHPLLGRRMPDLDLVTSDGPRRVFSLLHGARPVLLELADCARLDASAWGDRVAHVVARSEGAWELPVVGAVARPASVLVRPDGHVAWVGDGGDAGLVDALTTWFGPPRR